MNIDFLNPPFLLLLFAVPLAWFVPRRVTDRRLGALRLAVLVALVLALAQPVWFRSSGRAWHVFIVDRSDNLTPAQQAGAERARRERMAAVPERDAIVSIAIGAPSGIVGEMHIAGESASSYGAALAAAAREIPAGSPAAITVIGDGMSTDRHWGSAVQSLIRRGIPVDTVSLSAASGDAYVSAVRVEPHVRVGQTTRVEVDVIGAAPGLQVVLKDTAGEVARSAPMDSGGRLTALLKFEPRAAGYLPLTAELIAPGDTDRSNNQLSSVLPVQDALRVLYLGGRQKSGAARLAELLGRGFEVQEPAQALDAGFPLNRYDLVVLDDRPAAELPDSFQQLVAQAVQRRGIGLFYSGAQSAFARGGYSESTLARLLPVEFPQREEQRDPGVALAIILDTSSSMAGDRIDLAKQVARLTIKRLKPRDRVGIVEFYGAKTWAVPMQPARDRIGIDRAIGRMQAIGSTVLYPAIEEAYYGVKRQPARYKHIVVITDAGIEDAGFEPLIRGLAKEGITLSTVLVGEERFNPILFDMASWGKGQFYSVSDPFTLVELNFRQPSAAKLPDYRMGRFELAAHGAEGWWGAVERRSVPPLSGYVEVNARPGAEVLIEERAQGHPILASWQYGLGRVTALASEPVGAGTNSWRNWKEYGAMLGRVLSRTAADGEPFEYDLRREGGEIRVMARRFSRDPGVWPQLQLLNDSGSPVDMKFQQRAPGMFEAVYRAAPGQIVRAMASVANDPMHGVTRLVSAPAADVVPERQVDPARTLDLSRLSAVTGGRSSTASSPPQLAQAHTNESAGAVGLVRLAPWLLFLALLVYVAELIYRRSIHH